MFQAPNPRALLSYSTSNYQNTREEQRARCRISAEPAGWSSFSFEPNEDMNDDGVVDIRDIPSR